MGKYLAVDVIRGGRVIAKIDVAQLGELFRTLQVGLARPTWEGGKKVHAYDSITCFARDARKGLYVSYKNIMDAAPRIASFATSLGLREDRCWSLPVWPGKKRESFALRAFSNSAICIPLLVRIEPRKNTEPVVKVHFHLYYEHFDPPAWDFLGEGYMSWHSAIVLADCSYFGAKIALPCGGCMFGKVVADVTKDPNGREYGRGLQLLIDSLPGASREWARGFSNIFRLPLSHDRDFSVLDWTRGFPPFPV